MTAAHRSRPFSVVIGHHGIVDAPVLYLHGEVDAYAAATLADYLDALLLHEDNHFVIDLTDSTFVGTAGFDVIVRANKQLQRRGASLVVHSRGPTPPDLLDLAGPDENTSILPRRPHEQLTALLPVLDRRAAAEPSLPFFTDLRRLGSRVVVMLHGELDLATAPHLRETLADLIDGQGNLSMIIDLANLAFIDCSGLAVLVGALRRMRDRGGEIALRDPNPTASKLFAITGIDKAFPIEFSRTS